MPSPLSVLKNDYINNPKRKDIETPTGLCNFIHKIITERYDVFNWSILDPCAGNGNLTKPFEYHLVTIREFEIKKGTDFLAYKKHIDANLVLCNSPFNEGVGTDLSPWTWLKHIIKVVGATTPIALVTPMGFLLNNRIHTATGQSKRWQWMKTQMPPITSIISLPLDVFDNVLFHCEVLIFNMDKLDPHYVYEEVL